MLNHKQIDIAIKDLKTNPDAGYKFAPHLDLSVPVSDQSPKMVSLIKAIKTQFNKKCTNNVYGFCDLGCNYARTKAMHLNSNYCKKCSYLILKHYLAGNSYCASLELSQEDNARNRMNKLKKRWGLA